MKRFGDYDVFYPLFHSDRQLEQQFGVTLFIEDPDSRLYYENYLAGNGMRKRYVQLLNTLARNNRKLETRASIVDQNLDQAVMGFCSSSFSMVPDEAESSQKAIAMRNLVHELKAIPSIQEGIKLTRDSLGMMNL